MRAHVEHGDGPGLEGSSQGPRFRFPVLRHIGGNRDTHLRNSPNQDTGQEMAGGARRAGQQALLWHTFCRSPSSNTNAMKFMLPAPNTNSYNNNYSGNYDNIAVRGADMRHASHLVSKLNGRRAFLVDTLALVRMLEAQDLPSKQAEAITAAITEVLNDSLESVAQSFISKAKMQTSEMAQESALSKFKADIQSSQEHHFSLLQRETEKLRNDIDKMHSEIRYKIDKVTAGQRLDLNLERGCIHEELAKQNTETSNLTNKFDREIHALKTQLEAAKYDVMKCCIGTIVSVSAVGLGLLRVFM